MESRLCDAPRSLRAGTAGVCLVRWGWQGGRRRPAVRGAGSCAGVCNFLLFLFSVTKTKILISPPSPLPLFLFLSLLPRCSSNFLIRHSGFADLESNSRMTSCGRWRSPWFLQ